MVINKHISPNNCLILMVWYAVYFPFIIIIYTCICCSFNAHSNTLISIFNFDRRLSVRHEEKFYNPLDT
mgnify:CR=1 FL=1